MGRERRSRGLVAVLMGPVLVALLLLGLFSLLSEDRLAGSWPLGIKASEVSAYAALFDRQPQDTVPVGSDSYELSTSDSSLCLAIGTDVGPPDWSTAMFRDADVEVPVRVRRLRTERGGFVVKFPEETLFHTQRQLVLIPAGEGPIRAKFEQVLADELGVLAPEVGFVRLVICGEDRGMFIKEERVDRTFLRKHRIMEGQLVEMGLDPWRPDQLLPASDEPSMLARTYRERSSESDAAAWTDTERLVDWALLLWLCDREDLLREGVDLVHMGVTGRLLPVYRTRRGVDGLPPAKVLADRPLVRRLLSAEVLVRMKERREALLADRWRLEARMEAMEKAWMPLLESGSRLERARAARIAKELLDRLEHGDPIAWWDRPLVPPAGEAQYAMERTVRSLSDIAEAVGGRVLGDTLFLDRGRYRIQDDLILPKGASLVLRSGVRLEIDPGRSILCQGPLHVRATPLNPVFVRPSEGDSAFGTFAVTGDGDTPCIITGLRMSGGTGASVAGQGHSAMLSLHGVRLVMERSELEDGRGEDLVNVKDSEVILEDCRFSGAFSDLVDLDRCTGSVADCWFGQAGTSGEGDALDLGGGRLVVRDCTLEGATDKGMSVGEIARVVVRGCTFRGSAIAMAVKDLSIAHVEDCLFTDNELVFQVRQASGIYGGARLFLYPNTYVGNARDREVDGLSRIEPRDVWDEDRLEGL